MLVEIEDTGLTRDTDVIVTLFDSYGDGHYGDSDGTVVVSEAGDTLQVLGQAPVLLWSFHYGRWSLFCRVGSDHTMVE